MNFWSDLGWLIHLLESGNSCDGVGSLSSSPLSLQSSSLPSAVSVSSKLHSNSQQSSSEKVVASFSSSITLVAAGCGVDMARGSEGGPETPTLLCRRPVVGLVLGTPGSVVSCLGPGKFMESCCSRSLL